MPQITAAPMPVRFGQTTLYMSPMTDEDHDVLTNWMRSEIINSAVNSLPVGTPQHRRDEIIGAACARAALVSFGDPSGEPYMKTVGGVLRVFYQGFLARHPTLEWNAFRKMVKDAGAKKPIDMMHAVWCELNLQKRQEPAGSEEAAAGSGLQGEDVRAASPALQVHSAGDSQDDAVPAALAAGA